MKLCKDDPRLTAFALGEIEDEKERASIQSAIEDDPALQEAVQAIREIADLLGESLSAEEVQEMSEAEKARLEASLEQPARRSSAAPGLGRILSWPVISAGVAAVAVLALLLIIPMGTFFQANEDAVVVDLKTEAPRMAPPALMEAPPPEERQRAVESKSEMKLSSPSPVMADSLEGIAPSPEMAQYAATSSVARSPMHIPAEKPLDWNTEQYDLIEETGFRSPLVAPLSTFSIDVDTASYANVRRFLNQGQMPPADAVRIEELINYFPYADAPPAVSLKDGGDPFAVHMEQAAAPWNKDHQLLRIALKGYLLPWEQRPPSNLVFLLDVSGSMNEPNKLPLLKQAMEMLVRRLDDRDRVAIVVYAGASGLVLPSTSANNHATISHGLKQLAAGGSTNAGAGIQLAYEVAMENFIPNGNNRVILCTDGDFNVGQTNRRSLAEIAAEHADKGVSLTVLGFGMGNYKDGMLETLSNKGKGSYAYIDSESEARKVFLEDLTSNLFKIAKDVKIQVEFNPHEVEAYRLIGYENRRLKAEDFNNDRKKAGDIGPGHSVVALYEIVPAGRDADLPAVDPLKYQDVPATNRGNGETATVKLRYKLPEEETSRLITRSVEAADTRQFEDASDDLRFSAMVAAFGMRLRESPFVGDFSFRELESIAAGAIGNDPGGHRSAFTQLVRKAEEIDGAPPEGEQPRHTVNE